MSVPQKSMRRKKRRKKNERQLISQQKIKGRVLQKGDASSSHKNSTHMHILIWLYDLLSLLDPVFDFATCAARVCYLFIPYPELHKKPY